MDFEDAMIKVVMPTGVATLMLLSIVLVVASLWPLCSTKHECDRMRSKIKQVGGCDRDGDCGAVLEDGTVVANVHQATPGAYPSGNFCREVRF